MTTPLLYAALFYLATLLLGGLFGLAYYGPGAEAMKVFSLSARGVGLSMLLVGGLIGFFREKRKEQSQAAQNKRDEEIRDARIREQMQQTSSVRPIQPAPAEGEGHSEEVREYLKQTSAIDLKGISDFVKETRRHNLDDLKNGQ